MRSRKTLNNTTCVYCNSQIGHKGLFRHQHGTRCYTLRHKNLAVLYNLCRADIKNTLLMKLEILVRLPTSSSFGFRGIASKVYLEGWAPLDIINLFSQEPDRPTESASGHEKAEYEFNKKAFDKLLQQTAQQYRVMHPEFVMLYNQCL